MLHPEEDQPVNRSQKSTFKPADSGQFQIGTRNCRPAIRNRPSFPILRPRPLGDLGEVFEQHSVDEDVATAHFLQENQLTAVIEEFDKVKWRITLCAKALVSRVNVRESLFNLNYSFIRLFYFF